MSDRRLVTVEFGPLDHYSTLLIPPWVRNPTAMPRQDESDKLLVVVDRRFAREQWEILPLEDRLGCLGAFRLLSEGKSFGDPRNVQLKAYIPLIFFAHFKVTNLK